MIRIRMTHVKMHTFPSLFILLVWICLLFLLFPTGNAYSEEAKEDVPIVSEYRNTPPGSPEWTPARSIPEKFDWIQLTSGEWLKGDLKVLYDDKLEFDSDELGLQEFDWEDVKQVRGHRLNSVRFEGPVTVVGILKIVDDRVFVITGEEIREFDRSRLVTIAPGEEGEINYWSAVVSLSLNVKKGNSDQTDFSSTVHIQRRTAASRFSIDYRGIYTEVIGVETGNSHRANSYFDIFQTKRFFWRPVFGEYFRDPFSNTKHSVTVGSGVGYHIIDTSKTEWLFSPGIAYQYVENVSVGAGEDPNNSTPALVIATAFDTELTKRTDFNASYRCNIVNEEAGKYTHHALAALEFELTNRLDLKLSVIWDRIHKPKAEEDGTVPDQDDFYYFCGIEFEL
jgi:Protein of unknown function, DUF481